MSSENGTAVQAPPPEQSVLSLEWLIHHQTGWQFGEQGVIEAVLKEMEADIPAEHRWSVEFGAGDGATLPLTCEPMVRRPGWRSLLIEADAHKCDVLALRVPPSATIRNEWVKPTGPLSIDKHMEAAGCPATPALMVIDVDSIDYYIVAQMDARPYVLCIEHMDLECPAYNTGETFVPREEDAGKFIPGGFQLQANTAALDQTIPPMGYSLFFRTRVNSLYIRNDMAAKAARKPDQKIRLNIGAGKFNDPRYTPIDLKTGTDARKLPYADGTVAEIYASHVLEHFTFHERDAVLKEWVRVLEPGGLLRLAVPDLKKLAKEVQESDETGNLRHAEMILYGAHSDATDVHHAGYTEKHLRECMNRAGIGGVCRFHPFIRDDCSNNPMSLNLEGRKRWWGKIEKPRMALILSQPRFAFTGHELRLIELAKRMEFEVQTAVGAFWDRDMTVATQEAIAKFNPDFLFFSDYDSIVEVDDLKRLLEKINNDPEMAAIGCVQMSRHNDEPLVFDAAKDYSGELTKVDYQHFGLTIIRREVFEELPQPWFWSIPGRNAAGEWDWHSWTRSDADITFWRNLTALGFNIWQHNGVCIGHICQCVKYPRDKGAGVQYIPIENYWKHGKPHDATFNPKLYRPKPPAPGAKP